MAYEYILIKTRYGRRTISGFFRAITKRNKFERSQIGAVKQLIASSTTVDDFPIVLFVFMCGERFGCSLESEEELKSLITMLSETLMTIPLSAPLLSSFRSCLPFGPLCFLLQPTHTWDRYNCWAIHFRYFQFTAQHNFKVNFMIKSQRSVIAPRTCATD